jgi:hypothetical protein
MIGRLLLALSAVLAVCAPARAQDDVQCMAPVPVTAALIAEAGRWGWRGYDGAERDVLIGSLSMMREDETLAEGAHGAVVFSRGADGVWRAAIPWAGEDVVGAFMHDDALALFTMIQTEGPGPSWTFVRANADLSGGACARIAFPETLNNPTWANEFVDLSDFDIRDNERGEIIGQARVEREGAEKVWTYLWRTRDGGASWSAPKRLSTLRAARAGVFEPIGEAPPALVEALTRAGG